MKKAARKRAARPTRRPVIAMRVHNPLYEQIKNSAAKRHLSISEEAENRLQQSFQWDQTAEGQKNLIAAAEHVIAGGKEAAMRQWGMVPVGGRPGHWIEADKVDHQEMIALNPALETLIERVVIRTLEKAKQL
jgi:hypothetical protein